MINGNRGQQRSKLEGFSKLVCPITTTGAVLDKYSVKVNRTDVRFVVGGAALNPVSLAKSFISI